MNPNDPEYKAMLNRDMELARRELSRRSHDVIRVYNPLGHDFKFMYDRYWHTVPAKSYKDLERYLARQFFRKICEYMIGEQINKIGEDLKKKREEQMGDKFRDAYEENVQIWDKTPKLNDEELINEIRKIVVIGLVEEFGYDEPEPEEQEPVRNIDFTPIHDKAFDQMERVTEELPLPPVKEEVVEPVVSKKELKKQAEEVSL